MAGNYINLLATNNGLNKVLFVEKIIKLVLLCYLRLFQCYEDLQIQIQLQSETLAKFIQTCFKCAIINQVLELKSNFMTLGSKYF